MSALRDAILIVDDDDCFRELVAVVASGLGVEAMGACDRQSALDLIARHADRFKLILLDYFMPGMGLSEFVGRARAILPQEVAVVLVTAAVDPAARATEVGLSRWLSKPFEVDDLERLLSSSKASAA